MKIVLSALLFFILSYTVHAHHGQVNSLWNVLDKLIDENNIYKELKENKIKTLKQEKSISDTDVIRKYEINKQLGKEYKSYILDSAIFYLNENIYQATSLKDSYKLNETSIELSQILASAGMYCEAFDALENIDKNKLDSLLKAGYFKSLWKAYEGLAFYTQDNRNKGQYWQKVTEAKDSLKLYISPLSDDYLAIEETQYRERGNIEKALQINDKRLARTVQGTPSYAFVTFYRYLIYKKSGETDLQKKYLILSSISDIQSAITDNASISILADLLYKEGDIERADKYIRFSLDNINIYNTRLRSFEVMTVQKIIDNAYRQKSEIQKKKLRNSLIWISLLSLLLILAVLYVYKQMRKVLFISKELKRANQELKALNLKLNETNEELKNRNLEIAEANKIKEEYIAYFFNQCSEYIDKMDNYRKSINRLFSKKQYEEIHQLINDPHLKEKELKELFKNFDSIFLCLFPHFIDKFNALLLDGEHILLKPGEILNTELRIYALIRLGITDSSKIAGFLGYSVNTIYNYRAKIRNKAKGSREDFEWLVKKIDL